MIGPVRLLLFIQVYVMGYNTESPIIIFFNIILKHTHV